MPNEQKGKNVHHLVGKGQTASEEDQDNACFSCGREFVRRTGESWADEDKCIPCMEALMGVPSKMEKKEESDLHHHYNNSWRHHRPVVLELLKHNICLYDCDPIRQKLRPCDFVQPGVYNVIFGRFETSGNADFCAYGDILRKWSLRKSSCRLFYDADDEGDVVRDNNNNNNNNNDSPAPMSGIVELDIPYPGVVPTRMSFRYPADDDEDSVRMDPPEWQGSYGKSVSFHLVTETTDLSWIPNESVAGDSDYARQIRGGMLVEDEEQTKGPLLWLCRHKNVPESLSAIIRAYSRCTPKPKLTLQQGDLWLKIEMNEYSSDFVVELALRCTT